MAESVLEKLRRLNEETSKREATSDEETVFWQMENDLMVKTELLRKKLVDLDQANDKISDLTKELENMERENEELEQIYNNEKDKFTVLEDDNRKHTKQFVENEDNYRAFYAENEVLLESIEKYRAENEELRKSLKELNDDLEAKSEENEAMKAEVFDQSYLHILQDQLLDAQNLIQRNSMEPEDCAGLREDVRSLMNYNEAKVKEVVTEKEKIHEQLTELNAKCSILKNQLASNELLSDHLKLFASESKRSSAHFLESTTRQKVMTDRMCERLRVEESIGEKLETWQAEAVEQNSMLKRKLQEINEYKTLELTKVKNEIITVYDDDFPTNLTQIIRESG